MDTNEIIVNPIGCKVEVQWQDGDIEKFEIVSEDSKCDGESKISYDSQFGQSLIGKTHGDTVKFNVGKNVNVYKILSLQLSPNQNKYIKDPIERCIAVHNLTKLYHFTSVKNLASIMRRGILSREVLEKWNIKHIANDDLRLDNRPRFISCSVEYPNNTLLWSYNPFGVYDFCLLEIDIQALRDSKWALCCRCNAAKRAGSLIQPIEKIEELFGGERPGTLPINFPTDKQAEVLLYREIKISYIKRVIFQDENAFNKYKGDVPNNIEVVVDSDIFETRKD